MTERERLRVWRGRIVDARRHRLGAVLLAAPALAWIAAFLLVPGVAIVAIAFAERGLDGEIEWAFTLANLKRLAGHGLLGWSADYLRIFARSAWVATITTACAVALAYPLAFWVARRPARAAFVCLALIVVPMSTNVVIRAYAWQLVLSPGMPPARLAALLGFVEPGRGLFPSGFAVLLGMLSTSLPFAFLPLWVNVTRLDASLVHAARDLGAGPWLTFRTAILPQTAPGLRAAAVLTFVPAMGMFVMPDRLGGGRFMLVGNLMQQQFGPARDYPFGAAVSLLLIALTLAGLALYRRDGSVEIV